MSSVKRNESNILQWSIVVGIILLLTAPLVEAFLLSNRKHRERTQSANVGRTVVSKNYISFATTLFASPSSMEEFNDDLDGTSNQEVFIPKLLDGIAFNLFGIGRKDDEEAVTGAFQPPMNSMNGRVVVITGASSGLGLESAKRLALAGAIVIATARTPSKTFDAVQTIRNYCRGGPNPDSHGRGTYVNNTPVVHGITLDLSDLSMVREFPDRYRESMLSLSKISNRDEKTGRIPPSNTSTKKINVLMNNACGGTVAKRELTVDGFEKIFQTGYLGHFVLTARLFEEGLLNNNEQTTETGENTQGALGCKVISVSSSAHRSAEIYTGGTSEENETSQNPLTYGFDFNNVQSDLEFSLNTYSRTKLANIMFTKELQRRVEFSSARSDSNESTSRHWLTAVSVDPGVSATNIWSNSEPTDANWKDKLLSRILTKFMTKVERGANAHVWLAYASSSESNIHLIGGQHYNEYRNPAPSSKFANDKVSNQKLWKLSEELADIRFDL